MPETAFDVCAFWRQDSLARIGRKLSTQEKSFYLF